MAKANNDVISAFIDGLDCVVKSGTLTSEYGNIFYSYAEPMIYKKDDFYFVNKNKFSVTTSKQMGQIVWKLPKDKIIEVDRSKIRSIMNSAKLSKDILGYFFDQYNFSKKIKKQEENDNNNIVSNIQNLISYYGDNNIDIAKDVMKIYKAIDKIPDEIEKYHKIKIFRQMFSNVDFNTINKDDKTNSIEKD
jgi:hypothetical protein